MVVPLPDSFTYRLIDAEGVPINCAVAGDGPPVLLLNGYPQTHLIWHEVAPQLAAHHTVVLTDLRGYGDSGKPEPDQESARYSKRAMAHDQLLVMRSLGFDRFAVAGHDRGARVGHRLALDAPEAVSALAVLDIVPTRYALQHVDATFAMGYYHWFFLATGNGVPERLLQQDPEFWIRSGIPALQHDNNPFDPAALSEYVRCFSMPETIQATCADYRAALTIDLDHDHASAEAGQKIACPLLVLWGSNGFVGRNYDVLDTWRAYANNITGHALPCGHHLPEEAPRDTAEALLDFLH